MSATENPQDPQAVPPPAPAAAKPRETVKAEDIVKELSLPNNIYRCSDKLIEGRLDLKHCTVKPALEIIDCEFLNEVDFRYAEFSQTVNLSKCVFHEDFNSGDEGESQTVYQKDFICKESTFERAAGLNGARCAGSAFLHGTKFLSAEHKADFSGASFGKALELNDAVFKGPATFNGTHCAVMGAFNRVQFEHETAAVDFVGASSGNTLEFIGAVFKGGATFNGCRCELGGLFSKASFENPELVIDFSSASFGKILDFTEAVFRGGANFSGSICELGGFFLKARFENEAKVIEFYSASFGKQLNCAEALFRGGAGFGSVSCDSAYFDSATFESKGQVVDFSYASLNTMLSCRGATFAGPAYFGNVKSQDAVFSEAKFTNTDLTADFGHASFGWNLNCESAEFAGEANFNGVRYGGGAFFRNAKFTNDFAGRPDRRIDFTYSHVGVNLQLDSAEFHGRADFESSKVGGSLVLIGTEFRESVGLKYMSVKRLVLGGTNPFHKSAVDMRQWCFEIYEAPENDWKELVGRQDPRRFSRDPYLQLESYYRRIGDEGEADRVHIAGRVALRDYAKSEWARRAGGSAGRTIRWGLPRLAYDWLLGLFTGYGVKTYRLLFPILFFIALGAVLFWPDGALRVPPPKERAAGEQAAAPPAPEAEPPRRFGRKLYERVGYSLDLFLPVVDLKQTDRWQPQGLGLEIYATVHIIFGWLLIPLFLASISGLVRRQ